MTSRPAAANQWREARRQSARDAICVAAWGVAGEHGLAALSMRDLAMRAGTTTPTLYAYFDSKNAIYDAMFGQAARQFAEHMAADYEREDAAGVVLEAVTRFVEFCLSDIPRYQLLFQRTVPGFEPSDASYAHATAALDGTRRRLAEVGIGDPRHVDMLTAIATGLVDQQVSNDLGGDRWVSLIDEIVGMYLDHCLYPTTRGGPDDKRKKR